MFCSVFKLAVLNAFFRFSRGNRNIFEPHLPFYKNFMNQSITLPVSLRSSALGRVRSMRRGLLLGGVAGLSLFSGTLPLHAQALSGTTATKASSASARDILNKARAQEAAGSVALAAVFYREALATAPGDVSIARELAHFYARQNRLEEAAATWKRVLQLRTDDPEAKREMATLAGQLSSASQTNKTGVLNVGPLPLVLEPKAQTRALAQARATTTSPLPSVNASVVAALPSASATRSSMQMVASPPVLVPLTPSKNVSLIPFTYPTRRRVKVTDKRRIAAFKPANNASALLERKQTERALAEYQRAEQLDPNNEYATSGVAISQVILGRFGQAADSYRRFLSVAPKDKVLSTLRDLADALSYDRQYREALGVNDYILKNYASNTKEAFASAYQMAKVYSYAGDYTKANAAFKRALDIDPSNAEARATWGEILSYRRDPRAVQTFSTVLQKYPGNVRATLGLGKYYLYSGQFNLAIPRLRVATQKQPDNIEAYVAYGDALTYAGRPADALGPYSSALALAQKPEDAEFRKKANLGKGRALVYVGRYAEGARILNPIVAAEPNNAQALEALALARARTKSNNVASTYANLLKLEKEPRARARIYASIGDSQLSVNDIPAATQAYAQAAQLAPADPRINLTYAQLLYYNDQFPAAVSAAQRVLALPGNANNPQAKALLLQAALKNNDRETAQQIASQVENATPAKAEDSLALALALREIGNDDAARTLLLRAAAQNPDFKTKSTLASATRDADDFTTSIDLYQQLLKERPNDAGTRLGYVKALFWSNDDKRLPLAQTEVQSLLGLTPQSQAERDNYKEAQILGAQIDLKIGTPEARDSAVRLANAVLTTDPNNADARTILGRALVSLQRYTEAAPQLQAAVNQAVVDASKEPDNLEVKSRLANIRLELARALYYGNDTPASVSQYRELIALAPADTIPRLELADILLSNSQYAEADALYNEVLVLRTGAMLLPAVRQAIAANSLPRLSPLALEGSLIVRGVALVRPRSVGYGKKAKNLAPTSGKRLLLAQNPTVSGPTPSTTPGDLGTGADPLPDPTAPTAAPPTAEAPVTAAPVPQDPVVSPPANDPVTAPPANDPTTAPPTTQPGGEGGPDVAPPLQLQPGTDPATTPPADPPTTTETPTPDAGAPRNGARSLIDSPVDTAPARDTSESETLRSSALKRRALRGLGESSRRQNKFVEAADYFQQAIRLFANDYDAQIGLAQSFRGVGQFQDALTQVNGVLGVVGQDPEILFRARVVRAQLLADTGQTEQANTELSSLISSLSATAPIEYYIEIVGALSTTRNYQTALDVLGRADQSYPNEGVLIRLRAETLRSSGQSEAALALYDQLLSANPKDVQSALGKARTYYYDNRLPEAETAYQGVLSIDSTNVAAQRELAAVYTRRANYDAALTLYNPLLSANADDLEALLGRARAYNYSNRLPEAEADYRQLLAKGNNAEAQGELADILGRRENYTEAIPLYQSAINARPGDLTLRLNLARLQRRAGQSADAEATLNQVLEAEPDNVDALIERGLIRGNNGSFAAGLADLNRAQTNAKGPQVQAVQLGLAQLQLYSGNYIESINSYQAYLTSNPNDTRARVELAQALSYANKSSEALAEVDTVLKAVPDDVRAKLVQADIYARTGRSDEAVTLYNGLLTQDPKNVQARIGLGDALLYSRRYSEAVSNYDELLKDQPDNTAVQISRARALSYAGRAKEATAALRTIIAADPKNVSARLALAEVGANSGTAVLQRDAIGEYRAILSDYPDNLTAQLGLARVLSYRGEYAESSKLAEKILATNPGNNEARLVLADSQQYAGKPFDAKQNYDIITRSNGVSSTVLNSALAGKDNVRRATSPSIGVSGSYYSDTNGVRLRSFGQSAYLRTRALTIGVLADQGKFRQNNLAERNRRNIGILLARQFGPFAAQLIVSRLKYSGVSEKTLFNLSIGRDFTPRKRFNLTVARRDIFESDLAVGQGITATTVNLTGSIPLGKKFDLDTTATYYDYSDNNNRVTLSPALMFRFRPSNPTLRVGLGYIYDNTDEARNAPFVYYTPQNFNAAVILADYIVTTGKTRYGLSGAVPLTGSTGQNNINRPADTLFGFFERSIGDHLDFNVRGGIVRVPNGAFRSNQISGGLNYSF